VLTSYYYIIQFVFQQNQIFRLDPIVFPTFGLGLFGWLASLLIPYRPHRGCSSFAPRQPATLPPAKPEVIFE
ncbi:MAG TPA: hypothetical protein P5186_22600, partial [Candidatus Paceibacterota bacterium]|nr:hypothetical protein [Candidatus Paceibacterota bacterium]